MQRFRQQSHRFLDGIVRGSGCAFRLEPAADVAKNGARGGHERVQDGMGFHILRAAPDRAVGGEDDEVHGGPVGDDGYGAEIGFGGLQGFEEVAVGTHFACSLGWVEPGGLGAVVG